MYWTDKILLLRYFKRPKFFTSHLSKVVVDALKWAAIIHCIFGLAMYSYPYLLHTDSQKNYFGGTKYEQYTNSKRLGQTHIIIFFSGSLIITLMVVFDSSFKICWNSSLRGYKTCFLKCIARCRKEDYEAEDIVNPELKDTINSEDLYTEMSFEYLTSLHEAKRFEKQKLKLRKSQETFTEYDQKNFIDDYIVNVYSNEFQIYDRIMFLINN